MSGVLAAAVRDQVEDLSGRVAFDATDDFAGFLNRDPDHRRMQLESVRDMAAAVQRAVLPHPPDRIGPLNSSRRCCAPRRSRGSPRAPDGSQELHSPEAVVAGLGSETAGRPLLQLPLMQVAYIGCPATKRRTYSLLPVPELAAWIASRSAAVVELRTPSGPANGPAQGPWRSRAVLALTRWRHSPRR
jgi:hypothetical protein